MGVDSRSMGRARRVKTNGKTLDGMGVDSRSMGRARRVKTNGKTEDMKSGKKQSRGSSKSNSAVRHHIKSRHNRASVTEKHLFRKEFPYFPIFFAGYGSYGDHNTNRRRIEQAPRCFRPNRPPMNETACYVPVHC